MKRLLAKIVVIGGSIVVMGGCAYYPLKSPDVTPKGDCDIGVGVGATHFIHKLETKDTVITKKDSSYTMMVPLVYIRYGIINKMDISLDIYGSHYCTFVEARYQVSKNPPFALGLGVGMMASYVGVYAGMKAGNFLPYGVYRCYMSHLQLQPQTQGISTTSHIISLGVKFPLKSKPNFLFELSYSPHLFGITGGTAGEESDITAKYTLQALTLSGGINIRF
jgi:hypothetical protein